MVKTKKTELLFIGLFLRLLKPGGRCACIVPDGVLFGSSNAHKQIRKTLIDGHKLDAVISMPSGVFKPYAGVSTAAAILNMKIKLLNKNLVLDIYCNIYYFLLIWEEIKIALQLY